jgi:hypothetical protein
MRTVERLDNLFFFNLVGLQPDVLISSRLGRPSWSAFCIAVPAGRPTNQLEKTRTSGCEVGGGPVVAFSRRRRCADSFWSALMTASSSVKIALAVQEAVDLNKALSKLNRNYNVLRSRYSKY